MNRKQSPRKARAAKTLDVPALGPAEQIPVGLLKPHVHNPRTHSERQIALIAQSIETFGFTNPIIAEEDGTIIAGHGRWQAARQLGLEIVPVLRSRHLTPEKIRAYRIADNKLAELSGWDPEMLKIELAELSEIELDFSIETIGFQHAEIDAILDPQASASEAAPVDPLDRDIPEPPANPISRLGDLWLLDEHRLFAGSPLETKGFDTLMDGSKASMVFQDASCNVSISGHVGRLAKTGDREFATAMDESSAEEFRGFLKTNLSMIIPHLSDGAILNLFMDWRGAFALQAAMRDNGIDLINLAVWVKTNAGLLRSQHELVFIGKYGNASNINDVQLGRFRRRPDVWRYAGVNMFGRGRIEQLGADPTSKPLALVADALRDVSHRGQIVLDSFMGAGATLIAAERTGRIAYGMDIEPAHIDVCITRWQTMTGRQARLAETGQSFHHVGKERLTNAPIDKEDQP